MTISAVLVTRGDVDLGRILKTLPFDDVLIWNNAERDRDLKVYGRYAAIEEASGDVIYVQDDDCIVPVEDVVAEYEPGRLVANMRRSRWADYPDSTLVGWGAVFDRDLPFAAFDRFLAHARPDTWPTSDASERERLRAETLSRPDVVFSALTPRTVIDVGFKHLPWARTPGRMYTQPGHKAERDAVLEVCRRIRGPRDDDRRTAGVRGD